MRKLKAEKSRADSEIRGEISKVVAAIAAASILYRFLGESFTFNSNTTLRRRVDAELSSLQSRLTLLLKRRAAKVSEISAAKNRARYGISRTLSQDETTGLLHEVIEEDTADNRLAGYIGQLRKEMQSYMVVGIVAGWGYERIHRLFMDNINHPLSATPIVDRFGQDATAYGKGNYASAFVNMKRLDYDMTQRAYMRNEWLTFLLSSKVTGYLVYRNSSIPCELCDAYAGRVFPISSMVLPIHPRCICGATPVMVNRNELEKEA